MTKLKKWKLISAEDVSPNPYFPIEKRGYLKPDGSLVKDFYVDRLANPAHVVAITKKDKVVMIRMYKQGTDELMIQFPAGRYEPKKHRDIKETAKLELEEETGINVSINDLVFIGKIAEGTTKSTAVAHAFIVKGVEFNSQQKLDDNEEIEVLLLSNDEIDQYIKEGKIWDATAISIWQLAKLRGMI